MTEKQEHLLQLLREIDEICKKHHLRYVMAGGSLIGVVRNEGFIPWDDDVDIYMPRDDWDKFVEIARTELPPDRAIQSVDVDRDFTNTFPRYADTASCAIHKHQLIGNDKAGEIVDVLTLDPIPPDDSEYEKYRTHMMIYSELVNVGFIYGSRWEIPVTMYLKYLLYYKIFGRDKTLRKLEKIMFSYKEEDCSRYAMRWGGCPFLFDKDMMFPVKYMEFEGLQVMVPNRVSDYLIWHYGDEWSYIPPHDERSSHEAITWKGGTYDELRREYMERVDAGKIRRHSVIRKVYHLITAKGRHRLSNKRNLLKARCVEMDLEARIRENPESLSDMVKRREFAALDEIFSQYYQIQLSKEFIGREDFGNIYPFYHPVLLKISDEAFEAAMMTLICTERVAKAHRMLQIKEKLEYLTPKMQQMADDIVLFRKAACHYEMKEKEEAEAICVELLERYPDSPGFLKLLCRLVMERTMESGETAEAETFLAHAMEVFPEDGYFMKYQADLVLQKEGKDHALPLYAEAREKTNNGITLLEIEKYLKAEREEALMRIRSLVTDGREEEARSRAELWERLLPEDEIVRGYGCLVGCAFSEGADDQHELEELLKAKMSEYEEHPDRIKSRECKVWCEAMELLLARIGYPEDAAKKEVEMLLTLDQAKLKKICGEVLDSKNAEQNRAAVYKLAGDIQYKMGYTEQAFAYYQEALKGNVPSGILSELADVILNDLYRGGRKAAALARKKDASEYLDHWLGKYESIEVLQALVAKVLIITEQENKWIRTD
ncbi:MAG: LicD family protein [Blautia sp.]|nr:LicD family protein [Blautia sp.]